jgi:uncharacterized protein YkwD
MTRRHLSLALVVALLPFVVVLSAQAPAQARTGVEAKHEQRILKQVNSRRQAHGLTALRLNGGPIRCHDKVANRAVRRVDARGRVSSADVAGSANCRTVRLDHGSFRKGTTAATVRGLVRTAKLRRAFMSKRARGLALGTRIHRGGARSTVVIVSGPRRKSQPATPQLAPEAASMRSAIQKATNTARTQSDLGGLSVAACLQANAQRWAEQLASVEALRHQDMGDVFDECSGNTYVGENVAYNYSSDGAVMVDMWMDSPGHRANILKPQYTRIGVGVAQAANGAWFGVQVFGNAG